MAQTIQFRRGNEANLPTLAPGEPAVTLDSEKVFIGGPNGNIEVGGSGGPTVFQTLAEAQAYYPNGTTQKIYVIDENADYYWNGVITEPTPDTTAPVLTITAGGTFTGTKSVTMSANETATIYYTLDGSIPTTSSSVYSTALSISSTTTLKAFAKDTAGNSSAVQTVTYTLDANPPADTTAPVLTITPAATFTDTQTVVMSTNETADIYYTLDDSDPKSSGTKLTYTAPLTLTETDTVKAYARDTAGNESAVQTVTYTKEVPTGPSIIASDDFNRADNATSLGSATTGQAWTALTGTWGISGNQAYVPSTTNDAKAYIETNETDVSISVDVSGTGASGETGIYFKVVDANNWFRFITPVTGTSYLQKRVSGTTTTVGSGSLGITVPCTLKVTTKSDGSIEVFANDVSKMVRTDTALNTATKHGLGFGGANATFKFDNFKIESI